jgi:hypothetical protein
MPLSSNPFLVAAVPLTDFVAVGSGDFVYLTGGGNASGIAQSTVFRYDSLLHTYTPVAPLLAPRYRHGADILNGEPALPPFECGLCSCAAASGFLLPYEQFFESPHAIRHPENPAGVLPIMCTGYP